MKIKFLNAVLTCLILPLSFLANAGLINVGVISGGQATGNDVVNQLNDDTFFDFNASLLSSVNADSLVELSAFDVLILGDSGHNDNGYTPAMYSAVRSFLEAGGGVVTTGWFNYATDPLSGQSAIDAEFISPMKDDGYQYTSSGSTIVVSTTPHEILNGISDYQVTSNHHELALGVDNGAVVLGTHNGKVALAAQSNIGRSVYLGGQYMASTSYNVSSLRSGTADQLLEQSVNWAANSSSVQDVPEPSTLAIFALGMIGLASRQFKKQS